MKLCSILLLSLSFQLSTPAKGEEFHKENMAKTGKGVMNDIAMRLNNFNFNFNEIISKDTPGNIIYSPYSIYTALAMLGVGAVGETKKEIGIALSLEDDNLLGLLDMLQRLDSELSKGGNGSTLNIANKAWVGENTKILETYQDNISKYFNVKMGKEDFINNSEEARKNINEWVEQRTGEKIKELFPPASIGKMTIMALANAVYFKGEWEKKFDIEDTYEDDFYITKDKKIKVKFMFRHDMVSMALDNEHKVQLLELPYKGGVFSIIFVIPYNESDMNDGVVSFEDLNKVEATIKDKTVVFKKWIASLNARNNQHEIDILVPKFEIKLGVDLVTQLKKLGIHDAFIPGKADLSGINGKMDLYVSSGVHKAFIKVDEEGTTAAAATGFAANTFSMNPIQEVFLNHPFLFYIIHKDSNAIIFSGKVQNPLN